MYKAYKRVMVSVTTSVFPSAGAFRSKSGAGFSVFSFSFSPDVYYANGMLL
jgi:hypothetical protein